MRFKLLLLPAIIIAVIFALLSQGQEKLSFEVVQGYDERGKFFLLEFAQPVMLKEVRVNEEKFPVGRVVSRYKLYYSYQPGKRYAITAIAREGSGKRTVTGENPVYAEVSNESIIRLFSVGYSRAVFFSSSKLPAIYSKGCNTALLRALGFDVLTNLEQALRENVSIALICRSAVPWELKDAEVYAVEPEQYYVALSGRAYFTKPRVIEVKDEQEFAGYFGSVEIENLEGEAKVSYHIPEGSSVKVLLFQGERLAKVFSLRSNFTRREEITLPEKAHPGWNTVLCSAGEFIEVLPQGKLYRVKEHRAQVFLNPGEQVLLLIGRNGGTEGRYGSILAARKLVVEEFRVEVEKQGREYVVLVDDKPVLRAEKLPDEIKLYGYPVKLGQQQSRNYLPYIAGIFLALVSALIYLLTPEGHKGNSAIRLILPERVELREEFFSELSFPELDFEVYLGGKKITSRELAMSEEEIAELYLEKYPEEQEKLLSGFSAFRNELSKRFHRQNNLYGREEISAYLRKIRDYLIAHGYTIYNGKVWKKSNSGWVEVKPCLVLREEHIPECLAVEGEVLIFTTPELEEKLRKYEGLEVVVLDIH